MESFPRSVPLLVLAVVLTTRESASAQDWTRFRGPNGSGVVEAEGLPTTFGHTENVLWKAEVPFGRSSPVLAGEHIFLTGADEENLITFCVDRKFGRVRWRRTKPRARTEEIYPANDSASPAMDDGHIYVRTAEGLYCFGATVED